MGNWRTVNITGTMSAADAAALRGHLGINLMGGGVDDWPREAMCLAFDITHPGLCGLGAWPAETVSAQGNLFERDYSVQNVADALKVLVHIAPSMLLKVHCGGDWESDECVATIRVGEGLVVTGKPEVATITGPSMEQMQANLMRNLLR